MLTGKAKILPQYFSLCGSLKTISTSYKIPQRGLYAVSVAAHVTGINSSIQARFNTFNTEKNCLEVLCFRAEDLLKFTLNQN